MSAGESAVTLSSRSWGREQRAAAIRDVGRDITMASILCKTHFDRHTIARVNNALMVVLFGSGFFACMIGASVYDVGRLFSAW
jgi:hypothetical protein